jgi:hypothetical protein
MSTENLEQFMDNVADSAELQTKLAETIDAALIALGAECGCEFTADELHTEYTPRLRQIEYYEVLIRGTLPRC